MSERADGGGENAWEAGWRAIKPELRELRRSLAQFPSPPLKIMRVSQLDANLLDQELEHVLVEPVTNALALSGSSIRDRFQPEMLALLRGALHYLSIWDKGATYGSTLQNLRYRNEWAHRGALQSVARDSPITTLQKTLHALLTVLFPYLYQRLHLSLSSTQWSNSRLGPSSDVWTRVANVEKVFQGAVLANFLVFLYNGKYRSLADRVLGMRLVYKRRETTRNISFEFLNRQLVWSTLTEFLLFVLPLVNARKIQRKVARLALQAIPETIKNRFRKAQVTEKGNDTESSGRLSFLPVRICAICYEEQNVGPSLGSANSSMGLMGSGVSQELTGSGGSASTEAVGNGSGLDATSARGNFHMQDTTIHNAYETDCGHIYCYYCIVGKVNSDEDWPCLRCESVVKSFRRKIDLVEDQLTPGEVDEADSSERNEEVQP